MTLASVMVVAALVVSVLPMQTAAQKSVTYYKPLPTDIAQMYVGPVATKTCASGWQGTIVIAMRKSDGTIETRSAATCVVTTDSFQKLHDALIAQYIADQGL